MRFLFTALGCLFVNLLLVRPLPSQDAVQFAGRADLTEIQIVDQYDKPVVGARLEIQSLVFRGKPGFSISAAFIQAPKSGFVSDSEGRCTLPIPDVGFGKVAQLSMLVQHESFADFDDTLMVDADGNAKLALNRGVQIAVTAVDAELGTRVKQGLFAISEQMDRNDLRDWKSNGNGLLLSRRLRVIDKRFRLAQIVDGEALRFSDAVDVTKGDGERTLISDVPMYPSQSFAGRIADDVPRPVRNGIVSVCVAWPTLEEIDAYGPAGHWLAHAPIQEDGTFELKGLPRGKWIQVIASCDAAFNLPAPRRILRKAFPGENKMLNIEDSILPTIFEFDRSREDVVIRMQETQAAIAKCVDINGDPISNAKVIVERQQRFFHGSWASRRFRSAISTKEQLIGLRGGTEYEPEFADEFSSLTDVDGLAKLQHLPGKKLLFRVQGMFFEDQMFWRAVELEDHDEIMLEVIPPDPNQR